MNGLKRAVIFGALLSVALASACAESAVAPEVTTFTPPPETENVSIVLPEEDIILGAHLFGRENDAGVILSHMRPNDQRAWFEFAQEVADEGYAVLTYDFRGYGESEGDEDFDRLDEDLEAAIRFMRDRGKAPVFLVGASMGATTSLVVAQDEDLQGVVAVSPPAEFESQNAVEAIGGVTAPVLIVATEDDAPALDLDELLDAAPGSIDTQLYSGNAHGTALLQSEHGTAFRARILSFLRDHTGS